MPETVYAKALRSGNEGVGTGSNCLLRVTGIKISGTRQEQGQVRSRGKTGRAVEAVQESEVGHCRSQVRLQCGEGSGAKLVWTRALRSDGACTGGRLSSCWAALVTRWLQVRRRRLHVCKGKQTRNCHSGMQNAGTSPWGLTGAPLHHPGPQLALHTVASR